MNHPTELLPDYAAGVLPDPAAVEAHVRVCAECATEVESWGKVRSAVAERTAAVAAPAPSILAAIRERIGAAGARAQARPHPVPRYAGEVGRRPWRRALGLFTRQRTLIRWPVWVVSLAAIVVGGVIAAQVSSAGLAPRVLAVVIPLAAALAVAGACGSDREPVGELVAATPTSPRVVLLARLTLVLGVIGAGGALVTLALAPLEPVAGLLGLAAAWFGPLVPLSALSFTLSVLWRPSVGVGAAMALWLLRLLSMTGEIDRVVAATVERLWTPGAGVLTGAAVLVVVTVLLSPRLPHGRAHRAGF
ncbi:zf-HC2 domain-containing protein [Microtetraspora niveoalba]|uniref:zf-HC2 domain-containing protein n=1 Tax=Microtetraspora niveoalba TaxID=46175 RepID=UPI0008371649|nr:zf-HC2 domain-containing protein [Microtetraspora niveoalba]